MSDGLRLAASAHDRLVHGRRVRAIAEAVAPLLDAGWRVLDVGCGDGRITRLVAARARVETTGCDVLVREHATIPVVPFDGRRIPAGDGAFDAVMLIDVLHHTNDPAVLLGEAARVARRAVIVKDHRTSRPLARPVLRAMDWVGNRPHGVATPHTYWPEARWREAWRALELEVTHFRTGLGLYAVPARWIFETGLHFLACLRPPPSARAAAGGR